jgi:hypothetical protein
VRVVNSYENAAARSPGGGGENRALPPSTTCPCASTGTPPCVPTNCHISSPYTLLKKKITYFGNPILREFGLFFVSPKMFHLVYSQCFTMYKSNVAVN